MEFYLVVPIYKCGQLEIAVYVMYLDKSKHVFICFFECEYVE